MRTFIKPLICQAFVRYACVIISKIIFLPEIKSKPRTSSHNRKHFKQKIRNTNTTIDIPELVLYKIFKRWASIKIFCDSPKYHYQHILSNFMRRCSIVSHVYRRIGHFSPNTKSKMGIWDKKILWLYLSCYEWVFTSLSVPNVNLSLLICCNKVWI